MAPDLADADSRIAVDVLNGARDRTYGIASGEHIGARVLRSAIMLGPNVCAATNRYAMAMPVGPDGVLEGACCDGRGARGNHGRDLHSNN